jgi:hypothetical protein
MVQLLLKDLEHLKENLQDELLSAVIQDFEFVPSPDSLHQFEQAISAFESASSFEALRAYFGSASNWFSTASGGAISPDQFNSLVELEFVIAGNNRNILH